METVRFYSDSGDLLSAAFIALVFHTEIINKDAPQLGKFNRFLTRILKSYFDTLQQL